MREHLKPYLPAFFLFASNQSIIKTCICVVRSCTYCVWTHRRMCHTDFPLSTRWCAYLSGWVNFTSPPVIALEQNKNVISQTFSILTWLTCAATTTFCFLIPCSTLTLLGYNEQKYLWSGMFVFIVEIMILDQSNPFSISQPLMSREEIVSYCMSLSLSPRLGQIHRHAHAPHTHCWGWGS